MLFQFLRYISPTWYFNLTYVGNYPYFPDFDKLPAVDQSLVEFDEGYSHRGVAKLDTAYQAWHKGFVLDNPNLSFDTKSIMPSVSDNYRFIRHYFHPIWSWYVLFLRIITLHNPFKELTGFISQMGISRVNLYDRIYPHKLSKEFDADPNFNPKVSVIIPTLNRYKYLKDALHDLEKQDYRNFDVIIVDQSEPYQPEFYNQFHLDIKLIRQEEKALWLARNTAIRCSDSEFVALFEDDVRINSEWLSNHLKCISHFKCDISAGVFYPTGRSIPMNRKFYKWADQFATGNACLKKDVFKKIGLFDRQFEGMRMGDGEFGLRAYLSGFKSISNPYAWCEDIKAPEGGLRQMGSWDAFRPGSLWAPRPVPSVLYYSRKYFGNRAACQLIITNLLSSITPYRHKNNKKMALLYYPVAVLLLPLLLAQTFRSWRISSDMLKVARIEFLDK
jgi:glycosyltransferase involved in cell wall biosynthesis